MSKTVIRLAHFSRASLPLLAAELVIAGERCKGDGKPCYVGAGTEDAHWRCGTSGCGDDYLAGRSPASKDPQP